MRSLSSSFVPVPSFTRPSRSSRSARIEICCLSSPQTTIRSMKPIRGVSEIAANYEGILLDQFGVIHDGQKAYPRAVEAIRQLHESGLKIIILSNSSRPSADAVAKLEKMGVNRKYIHGAVTSGQLALGEMKNLMAESPQSRVLHFTWSPARGHGGPKLEDHNITKIAPLSRRVNDADVPCLADVDFILAHGTDAITSADGSVQNTSLDVIRSLCAEIGRGRPNVPFYCANPDMVTVDGPELRVMPGTLAQDFEVAGGVRVTRLGKPDVVAYDAAMELLRIPDKQRILAIGDSLGHDILGAENAGIDSLYVGNSTDCDDVSRIMLLTSHCFLCSSYFRYITGGINAVQFGVAPADGFKNEDFPWQWDESMLNQLIAEEAPGLVQRKPTYFCPFFRW